MRRLINTPTGIADGDEMTAVRLAALDLVEGMLNSGELLGRDCRVLALQYKPDNPTDTWWLYVCTAQLLADILRCDSNRTAEDILEEIRGVVITQGLLDDGS